MNRTRAIIILILWALVIVIFPFLGTIGSLELGIWVAMILGWFGFLIWTRSVRHPASQITT